MIDNIYGALFRGAMFPLLEGGCVGDRRRRCSRFSSGRSGGQARSCWRFSAES